MDMKTDIKITLVLSLEEAKAIRFAFGRLSDDDYADKTLQTDGNHVFYALNKELGRHKR